MIDHYLDGQFFYTPLHYELEHLKELAESFCNAELVDEIHELCYDNNDPKIGDILHSYWMGCEVSQEQRKTLEWFYVAAWIDGGVEV